MILVIQSCLTYTSQTEAETVVLVQSSIHHTGGFSSTMLCARLGKNNGPFVLKGTPYGLLTITVTVL